MAKPKDNPSDNRLTFVDIFAGCGGLSLGLKRAGWKGLFAIEKDEFAFETLSSNFPDTSKFRYHWPPSIERKAWDIHALLSERKVELESLSHKVTLLAGGPPCQGFSHAGKRRIDDPRNSLFKAYLELVDILKPALVLIENVRGFQSDFKKTEDHHILNYAAALSESLSDEYFLTSSIIKAKDYGVPQNRPRYFLIAARKGLHISDIESFFSRLEEGSTQFLSGLGLSKNTTAKDAISDLEVTSNNSLPSKEWPGFEEIGYKKPKTKYQEIMRDGFSDAPKDTRLANHRPDIRERFADIIKASYEEGRLNTTISKETREKFGLKKMAIRVLDPLKPAPTITSLPDDLLHYSEPRILTVRENARLQSFPDWFAFKGKYTTGGHRRRLEVPRYTQVANAVPPLLAEQIGLTLKSFLLTD